MYIEVEEGELSRDFCILDIKGMAFSDKSIRVPNIPR